MATELRQEVDEPPPPRHSDWRFIPCGLKLQDEDSRITERGGWALPRTHVSLSESGDLPTYTWAERLPGSQKGSDAN